MNLQLLQKSLTEEFKTKKATTVFIAEGLLINVVYHNTIVASIDKYGNVSLYSGGYRTQTTKSRMNVVLSKMNLTTRVVQRAKVWFVISDSGKLEFFEGIIVSS